MSEPQPGTSGNPLKAGILSIRILFLGDNAGDLALLRELLQPEGGGFSLEVAETLEQGIGGLTSSANHPGVDVVLLAAGLPDSHGLQGLARIRQKAPHIPVLVIIHPEDKEKDMEAIEMGAQECLAINGLNRKLLVNSLRYSIERQRLMMQLREETARLDKSEAQLRKIIEKNTNGMIILDTERRICFMNPAAQRLMGESSSKLPGKRFKYPIEPGQSVEIEIIHKKRRSQRKIGGAVVEMGVAEIHWKGQPAYLASLRDITLHKKMERSLVEEKERLDVTLRSIGAGVLTTGAAGEVVLINRVMETLCGWTQNSAPGKPAAQILKIETRAKEDPRENPVEITLKTGKASGVVKDRVLVSRQGSEYLIEYHCSPLKDEMGKILGTVLIIRDVTRKKEMEEQLIKSRKLESLGILAAGLAHEYNNELTAVLGNISMVSKMVDGDDNIYRRMSRAEESALQAKELTRLLLTFSKGGEPIKTTGPLLPLVKEAAAWARQTPGISCQWRFPRDLPTACFDQNQVKQALGNIVKNAVEAMPRGGLISIKGQCLTLDREEKEIKPGCYIKISVQDQGVGIAEENLAKVFDPYFKSGKTSAGMGLTTAYSIIKKHGGTIRAESTRGVGSTFHLLLPAVVSTAARDDHKPGVDINAATGQERKQKILVMDDNPIIQKVARNMLNHLGYKAMVARNGQEALRLYQKAKREKEPFAAVILDLLVPRGMGGKECLKKLLKLDRSVKAIVCSGYSDDPVVAEYEAYGFKQRLPKPFKIDELSCVLSSLLSPGLPVQS